jgi:hypothetical protein
MSHGVPAAPDELATLLEELRRLPGLVEKKRGVFYRRSQSFLQLHEDPSGLYADVRAPHGDFLRFQMIAKEDQAELLRIARDFLTR